jgi:dihydropteroate synthase
MNSPSFHPSTASTIASTWSHRRGEIVFARRPAIMGILNVTPDSFSDGGAYADAMRAVDRACEMISEGASIIDIGGESTRPYSSPVTLAEELARVIPVIERIRKGSDIAISIDTSKAEVARQALAAGADIINDVTGLEGDPEMLAVALDSGAGVCAMHMQGTPQTMQDNPTYADVVEEILGYLKSRREALAAAGIARAKICLDPGIGFGKTHEHNLTLLAQSSRFHSLGGPVLVGHSRKGFIGKVLGDKEADRTFGSVGVSLALARQRVQVLRVHDVRAVHEALLLFDAAGGLDFEGELDGASDKRED